MSLEDATGMDLNDKNAMRRKLALAMMQQGVSSAPRNLGEGINSASKSIVGALMGRDIEQEDAASRAASEAAFGQLTGGMGGGVTPATPSMPSATPSTGGKADAGQFQELFGAMAQKYGLPEDYLPNTAKIESNFNPLAKNPNSSAGGMFQFIDSTAKQYGLNDKFDPAASTEAAARLAVDNKQILENALGRPVTSSELYMAHQQGAGGALKALQNPNAQMSELVGGQAAGLNNLGGATGGQFAQKYASQFGQPYQVASNSPSVPAPTPQNDTQAALYSGVQQANGNMPAAQPPQQVAQSGGMDAETMQLIKMKNDPYLSPANRAIAGAMAQQRLKQMEAPKYGFQNAGDTLYRTDPKTGNVTPIATPNKPTNKVREFEYAKEDFVRNGGNVKDFPNFTQWDRDNSKAGASSVNLGGGSDKQIFDSMAENAKVAQSAVNGLTGIRNARASVQAGGIFGAGADERLGLQKIANYLGAANSNAIENTETFRAAIAPQVAAMLKATVGTTQISNTDREFAQQAAGGSINLNEGSILRLMDIMEQGANVIVKQHQRRLDKVYPDKPEFQRERALFGIDTTGEPQAPVSFAPQPLQSSAPTQAPAKPQGAQDGWQDLGGGVRIREKK
jgi:hypothetical protein